MNDSIARFQWTGRTNALKFVENDCGAKLFCRGLIENFFQSLVVERLGEMMIKTRLSRILAIAVAAPTGLRNQGHVAPWF